jgi:hypothetical protein
LPDVFHQHIFAHDLTAVEQQKRKQFEFEPGERAGPAVYAEDAGEAIQFKVSVSQDERGYQSLYIYSSYLMHIVSSSAPYYIPRNGAICERL